MNPIDKVRERLDGGRLWQKGSLGEYDLGDTPVCLVGACYAASTFSESHCDLEDSLRQVIGEQYPDRNAFDVDGMVHVPFFNDHAETTWADVELVLDKASVLWDEAHS